MQTFDDLIKSYLAADLEPGIVQAWYREHSPSDEALSALAESIGAMFLAGQINFMAANGLLNDLMPLAGFEAAPKRFWQYYIAFEDYETSTSPDSDARSAVAALASGAA
jgi:hypothetical protein